MGNYNRLLSGEFPPPLSKLDHERLVVELQAEEEKYDQELTEWVEQINSEPQVTIKQEGE